MGEMRNEYAVRLENLSVRVIFY